MTVAADTGEAARPVAAAGWLLVTGIVLATLTDAIASTALSLGRFDMIGDLHATPDEFAWLDVGYVALKLIAFIITPWLLTRWPPQRCLLASTLVMCAACALTAAFDRADVLTVLRAIQGLAGGAVLVSGQALLFLAWPRSRQPFLQALFAMGAVVAPATFAPALQGWLIDSDSWTWIFLGVAPLALSAAGLILMAEEVVVPPAEPRAFDGPGFALLLVAVPCLTYVVSQGSRWDWFEARRIVVLSLIGTLALVAFIARQWQGVRPGFLDRSVFASPDFAFAFLVSFVAGAALLASAYLIPAFALSALAFTPTGAGALLLPSGGLFIVTLLLAAYLVQIRRMPPIATVPAGILLFMTAMWMLSTASGDSGADSLAPAVLLRGLGLGFLFLAITLIAFNSLPAGNLAYGIGLFNMGRQVGGLVGIAAVQTFIDHQIVGNHAVLAASLTTGAAGVSDRLTATATMLIARGVDPESATRTAAGMLGRSVSNQATVIAFDTAFNAIALLFVIAAPLLIAAKIGLARAARRGPAAAQEPV